MAPTICCRDVSHKLHRRQQKQLPIAAASAENEDEVMTTGSGGGMSLAASGRTRMVAKNQRTPKNAAIRRRRRRGVAWLLHEIEDSRISTTTANSESVMVKKNRYQHQVENSSEEEYEGSDTEAELDSRVGRLSDTPEAHKRPGGLLGITMRTVELIRRNQLLQWRLSMLQEETRAFVKSVMSNPENQRVDGEAKTNASDGAQDPAVSGSC